MITPIQEKEISPIKGQITKNKNKANEIIINSEDSLTGAIDILSNLKKSKKEITTLKESWTKPLNQTLKGIRDFFREPEASLDEGERIIKGKMITYEREKADEARKIEEKLQAEVLAGKKDLEEAVTEMAQVETIAKKVESKKGSIQYRTVRTVEITNESILPRKYLSPNMVLIRKDALDGTIGLKEGVTVVEEKQIASY